MAGEIVCSYIQVKYKGRLGAQEVSCNKGDVCKFFEARFFNPKEGHSGPKGQPPIGGKRPTVHGAVWLTKPSAYTTRPDYISTNSINTGTLPQSDGARN